MKEPNETRDHWITRLQQEHGDELRRFARRIVNDEPVAEEIVQDTFLEAWLRMPEECASERAWLFAVVFRRCISHKRHEGVVKTDLEARQLQGEPVSGDPSNIAIEAERKKLVRWAIKELPKDQRKIVFRKVFREMTIEAIAETMGLSLNQCRFKWTKASRTIRFLLSDTLGSSE